jgi:ketosteroid isomerase-like protein
MKISLVLAVVVLFSVTLPLRLAAQPKGTEDEIRELETQVNAAYAANDLPKYFSYYAADFTQWLPEGRTNLPEYVKMWTDFIHSGGKVESNELSAMQIQLGPGGDTAIASYHLRVKTRSAKGDVDDGLFQETDVWFKRGGEWKIVHLHYSPAPKKE